MQICSLQICRQATQPNALFEFLQNLLDVSLLFLHLHLVEFFIFHLKGCVFFPNFGIFMHGDREKYQTELRISKTYAFI